MVITTLGIAPSVINQLDSRFRNMPPVRDPEQRCMHTRAFRSGLTGWGKWTADDHVALLQQMAYIVGSGSTIIRTASALPRKAFVRACDNIRTIYLSLKKREVSEAELLRMHTSAKNVGPNIKAALQGLPLELSGNINLNIPKVHGPLHYR